MKFIYASMDLYVDVLYYVKVKVNQSRYRPGVAKRVPGS